MNYFFSRILVLCAVITLSLNSCQKEDPIMMEPPVVTIQSELIIQLPENSITLEGSATSKKNKIVGYLWSEVSGPNVPDILSESSPSTAVNNLVAGIYIFQLMAIDDQGLTGLDTVSFTVSPSSIQSINLQPTNNPDEVFIWGNNTGFDHSKVESTELGAAEWTDGGQVFGIRSAFKFDLSGIPANATITGAKLSLYSNPETLNGDHVNPNAGTDNGMLIQRITAAWNGYYVNWHNLPPTTTEDQIEILPTDQGSLDLIDVDVVEQVKKMINENTNFGFLIRLKNETLYNSRMFCSSKYHDNSKHPKLLVQYIIH